MSKLKVHLRFPRYPEYGTSTNAMCCVSTDQRTLRILTNDPREVTCKCCLHNMERFSDWLNNVREEQLRHEW